MKEIIVKRAKQGNDKTRQLSTYQNLQQKQQQQRFKHAIKQTIHCESKSI